VSEFPATHQAAIDLATRPCPECGEPVVETANVRLDPDPAHPHGVFGVWLLPGAILAGSGPNMQGSFAPHECER
jgi:hypothetical protein